MTRSVVLACVSLLVASTATAQELAVAADEAPAPPAEPRHPLGIGGWVGVQLNIGAGRDPALGLDQVDMLPSLDWSMTVLDDNLRLNHRVTYGVRQLYFEPSDSGITAQTVRSELGIAIESDVGPYIGGRVGGAYTWDLAPDANGERDRFGVLLGLDAGLNFRMDRDFRLGLGASYTAEPETGGYTVMFGLQTMMRVLDV